MEDQRVRVEVFDMVGRHVGTRHDAEVAGGHPMVVSLQGSELHPGVCSVRVTGETFVHSQHMTVVR